MLKYGLWVINGYAGAFVTCANREFVPNRIVK
jgi:hypothetical protein